MSTAGRYAMPATIGGKPDGNSKHGSNRLAESSYVRDEPKCGEVQPVRRGGRAGVLDNLGRDENKKQMITSGSRLLQVQLFTSDVNVILQQWWFDV